MTTIEFENGRLVEFEGTPTQADIDEVAQSFQPAEPQGVGGLKGVGLGVAKGLGSTALGLSNIGEKFARGVFKTILPKSVEQRFKLDDKTTAQKTLDTGIMKPHGTAEKGGYIGEQIAEFVVPGGAISRLGKATQASLKAAEGAGKLQKIVRWVTGFGARSAVEGAGASTIAAAQGGDAKSAFAFGAAAPSIGGVFKGLGFVGKEVAKHMSSTLSGVPKAALEEAFKNPRVIQQTIARAATEGTDLTAQRISSQAIDALDVLKEARSTAYQNALANFKQTAKGFPKQVGRFNEAGNYIPSSIVEVPGRYIAKLPNGKSVELSTLGVKNVATKTMKDFGLNARGPFIDIGESSLQRGQVNKLQEMINRIYNWKNVSPVGLDKLRQVVDGYRLGGINLSSSEKQFNKIVGTLRTNLAGYVDEKFPAIKEMRKEYAAASDVIENIQNQLKLESKDPNTALRKLINVFNPKSQVYRPVVRELGEKAGIDLMSDIAGLTLSQWTPEGLGKYFSTLAAGGGLGAGIFNPSVLGTLPVTAAMSSPRLLGSIVTNAGKVAPAARRLYSGASRLTKGAITRQFSH